MPFSTAPSTDEEIREGRPLVRYLDTVAAYDLWSEVYDTDGNFLQALDTLEMQSLLPQMLSQITELKPWKICDLGCGTGRNTLQLLNIHGATIIGMDASTKMLELARSNVSTASSKLSQGPREVNFELYDLLEDPDVPLCSIGSDALISTLVLEHLPLPAFFHVVYQILKPGGIALVTNMHSDMGAISQAGFVDPSSGEKVRPQSFPHRVEDVITEAKNQGFEVIGQVRERCVDDEVSGILGARAKKWIGVMVWFGMLVRKRDQEGSHSTTQRTRLSEKQAEKITETTR